MATKCLKDGTRCWKGNYMLKESRVNVILTCKNEIENMISLRML